jgi:hypothetical protein
MCQTEDRRQFRLKLLPDFWHRAVFIR